MSENKTIFEAEKDEKDESADQSKKLKDNSKPLGYKGLVISMIMIVFLHFSVTVALFVMYFYRMSSVNLLELSLQNSIISSGLAIIAIAVAVWAAINITNAITRQHLDEKFKEATDLIKETKESAIETKKDLNEKFKEAATVIDITEKSTAVLNRTVSLIEDKISDVEVDLESYKTLVGESTKTVGELKKSINTIGEKSKDIARGQFLNLLFTRVEKDGFSLSKYFYDELSAAKSNEIEFIKLIQIENSISLVNQLHQSQYKYDSALVEIANKGIEVAKKLVTEISKDDSSKQLVCRYLRDSIAHFIFYTGYCDADLELCVNNFKAAIKAFKELFEEFGNSVKVLEDNLSRVKPFDQEVIQRYVYLEREIYEKPLFITVFNGIGESLSKISHYKSESKYIIPQDEEEKKRNIESCLEGIKYLILANYYSERKFEMYVRNLGCAYERYQRLHEKYGRDIKDDEKNINDIIIDTYKEALIIGMSSNHKIDNSFHTLLFYKNTYLDGKYNFKNQKEKNITFTCDVREELKTTKKCQKQFYTFSKLAIHHYPSLHKFRKMYIFALFNVIVLKYNNVESVSEEFIEPIEKYMNLVSEQYNILEAFEDLDDNFGYLCKKIVEEIKILEPGH